LQALISSLLFEIEPPNLAMPSISKGTTYIKPLRMALGRYPVIMELNPGLLQNKNNMSESYTEL
jgi:hypothetical protein